MARIIIDSHNHIINQPEPVWGWGPKFTVEQLIAMMDREYDVMGEVKRVSKAIVMTGLGLTSLGDHTMREAHEYVIQSVLKYPDRLFMNAVMNPRLWGSAEMDQLNQWQEQYNLRMLKIHPTMHNYLLPMFNPYPGNHSRELVYPIWEKARELDVPIMIHMGESPFSIPATVAPVAETFPDVPIIVAHAGANNEESYATDAILLARTHDNVFLECSWVQPLDLQQAAHGLGADKLIFGSDGAPNAINQQLRNITNLHLPSPLGIGLSEDEIYKMIGGNIAQLCKIPLEEPVRAQHVG
ncbi:MAG: amidohydrolase family protein [Ardenticatenaceae bacterium]|nr:amidohydrolase family protein [Ardenticatenaceae bacterium]HBY97691.1 hypothetical protein [Chloroflexota bacterium]